MCVRVCMCVLCVLRYSLIGPVRGGAIARRMASIAPECVYVSSYYEHVTRMAVVAAACACACVCCCWWLFSSWDRARAGTRDRATRIIDGARPKAWWAVVVVAMERWWLWWWRLWWWRWWWWWWRAGWRRVFVRARSTTPRCVVMGTLTVCTIGGGEVGGNGGGDVVAVVVAVVAVAVAVACVAAARVCVCGLPPRSIM